MEKTIESVKSETKEELKMEQVRGNDRDIRFDVTDIAGKYSGNGELWAIWYSQVYGGLFELVDTILGCPLENEQPSEEDIYGDIYSGVDSLIDYASENTDIDTQPLYKLRERVESFEESSDDKLTLIITLNGPDSSLEYVDGYFDDGIVTVDVNGEPTVAEKSTLTEYRSSLMKSFCFISPYQNRPNNRFKRELHVSMDKSGDTIESTIDLQTHRVEYALTEKILLKLGFSTPYREEPIKQIN